MNEATIKLSEDQSIDWATATWKQGYLAGLQRFVSADIERVTIEASDGTELGVYERAWQAV